MSYPIDIISLLLGFVLGFAGYWAATHVDEWFEDEPWEDRER